MAVDTGEKKKNVIRLPGGRSVLPVLILLLTFAMQSAVMGDTVLLVVIDPSSLTGQESARKTRALVISETTINVLFIDLPSRFNLNKSLSIISLDHNQGSFNLNL